MSNKKKILYVNWGTPDKEYTFKAAAKKDLAIYLATFPGYPDWIKTYVSAENIIVTNTYDADVLISDVVMFMKQHDLEFDAVLTFFEMNIVQTADLAQALNKPFLNPGAARRSSANKLLMRVSCQQQEIPTPQFAVFTNLKQGLKELKKFNSPVVIKAVRSGHSYGVMKVMGKSRREFEQDFTRKYQLAKKQLDANFDEWMEYYQQYKSYFLIEEYLAGVVFSFDGLIQNKKIVFSALTEYEVTPGPYLLQNATFIPARFSPVEKKQSEAAALKIIQALDFNNCGFHIEMKLTKNGPILLEAAARLPGGKILDSYQEVYGVDLASLFIDLLLGKRLMKRKGRVKSLILIEAVYSAKKGVVTQVADEAQVNIPGFTLLSYIELGKFNAPVVGIPPMYLYYQLKGKSWDSIAGLREKVKRFFSVKIEKPKTGWRQRLISFFQTKKVLLISIVFFEFLIGGLLLSNFYLKKLKEQKEISVAAIDKKLLVRRGESDLKFFYEPQPNEKIQDHPAWLDREAIYTINPDTLNERYSYSESKPKDTFRIVALGDSHTFGHFVSTSENYPERLEDFLNSSSGKKFCPNFNKVEVINSGMMGFDVEYAIHRYELRGSKYDPDLILWFLKNDDFTQILEEITPRIRELEEARANDDPDYLNDPVNRYNSWMQAAAELEDSWGLDKIVEYNNKLLIDFLSNESIPVVFIAYSDDFITRVFLDAYKKTFNHVNVFDQLAHDDISRLKDDHPSAAGYDYLSKTLAFFLISSQNDFCKN